MDPETTMSFIDENVSIGQAILVGLGAAALIVAGDKFLSGFFIASGLPQPQIAAKGGAIIGAMTSSILGKTPSQLKKEENK